MCASSCLFCFSNEPPSDGDWRNPNDSRKKYYAVNSNRREFNVTLDKACDAQPCCCMASFFCYPIGLAVVRQQVLNHTGGTYQCCQGYTPPGFPQGPCSPDGCERNCCTSSCPTCCNLCEAFCCPGCHSFSTRFVMMDEHDLVLSPIDFQIFRCQACIQQVACICEILACFDPQFRDLAQCIDCLADLAWTAQCACMVAQIYNEIKYQESLRSGTAAVATPIAPTGEKSPLVGQNMDRE